VSRVPCYERSLRRRRSVGRRRHDLFGHQVVAQATRTDRIDHFPPEQKEMTMQRPKIVSGNE
jgi:hypothetical protein